MKVLFDKVLVKRSEPTETKKGSLFIVSTDSVIPSTGVVISTGDGMRDFSGTLWPVSVVEGDFVHFQEHAGTELEVDGETYIVLRESEILLVA